jgi:hypothetical protein
VKPPRPLTSRSPHRVGVGLDDVFEQGAADRVVEAGTVLEGRARQPYVLPATPSTGIGHCIAARRAKDFRFRLRAEVWSRAERRSRRACSRDRRGFLFSEPGGEGVPSTGETATPHPPHRPNNAVPRPHDAADRRGPLCNGRSAGMACRRDAGARSGRVAAGVGRIAAGVGRAGRMTSSLGCARADLNGPILRTPAAHVRDKLPNCKRTRLEKAVQVPSYDGRPLAWLSEGAARKISSERILLTSGPDDPIYLSYIRLKDSRSWHTI